MTTSKKLRVFGVPWQLKLAKFPDIVKVCREFIEGIVIIVKNTMRDLANISVLLVVGRKVTPLFMRRGKRGGKIDGRELKGGGLLSVDYVERSDGNILIKLKEAMDNFAVGSVQTFSIGGYRLVRRWARTILCIGKGRGIILMEAQNIIIQMGIGER